VRRGKLQSKAGRGFLWNPRERISPMEAGRPRSAGRARRPSSTGNLLTVSILSGHGGADGLHCCSDHSTLARLLHECDEPKIVDISSGVQF